VNSMCVGRRQNEEDCERGVGRYLCNGGCDANVTINARHTLVASG
jgi:sulfatase maturation enzyme AslB (radical SAM superfamily)